MVLGNQQHYTAIKLRCAQVIAKSLQLAILVTLVLAGIAMPLDHAVAVSDGGSTNHGPWQLQWEGNLEDWGGGSYYGNTLAWVSSSTESSFYIVTTKMKLIEVCSGLMQTDYQNSITKYNQPVPIGQGMSSVEGYATGLFDCVLQQGLIHENAIASFPLVHFQDATPYPTDIKKVARLCINIRAGNACS